jgi:hypothetical protein
MVAANVVAVVDLIAEVDVVAYSSWDQKQKRTRRYV